VEERARGNAYGMNAQDITGDDFERWIEAIRKRLDALEAAR